MFLLAVFPQAVERCGAACRHLCTRLEQKGLCMRWGRTKAGGRMGLVTVILGQG